MSDLERYIRANWSYMCPAERLLALMDLGQEKGLKPTTTDEWMMWAITPEKED